MRLALCTGSHRSGTSLTAAALQQLGAELRLSHLGADHHNPRGYYEHWDVVALNDRILAELGSTWDTPTFDGPAALATGLVDLERKEAWIEKAASLICQIGKDASLAAIKDPRICLLAPIWIEAAARAGVARDDLLILHVYRDPVEVALSLSTRVGRSPDAFEFGRSLAEGAALWLAYTGQLYEAASDRAVTVVSHRSLIHAPGAALLRLADVLGVRVDPERLEALASDTVDRDLYRSRSADPDREGVLAALPALREMTSLLEEAAAVPQMPGTSHDRIRDLWNDPGCREAVLSAAEPALGRLNYRFHQGSLEVAQLRAALATQGRKHADETQALHASISRMQESHRAALADQSRQMAERAETDRQIISGLEKEAATHRRMIADREREAASHQRIIFNLEKEKAALLAFRNEMLASTSWRVTMPIRAAGQLLRRTLLASGPRVSAPDPDGVARAPVGAQEPWGGRLRLPALLPRARAALREPGPRPAEAPLGVRQRSSKAAGQFDWRGVLTAGRSKMPDVPEPTKEELGRQGFAPAAEPPSPAILPDPGNEFASTYLRRLRTLTGSWPGEAIGEEGLLHVLNPTGSKPPLLWCFNGEREFTLMAAGLGPDQPVIGMRSLNQVAPGGPIRSVLGERLADHYVEVLKAGLSFDRCAVGGNCQSAAIATRMALRLMEAGKQVELLLTLEGTPPVPYPGRVALLFGRESETHNPFFREERPQDLWLAIHREVSWTIVPGAHGQYFTDANIGPLCAAIREHLIVARAAPPLAQRPKARLVLPASADRVTAGSLLVLPAEIKDAEPRSRGPYHVLALWWSDVLGAWPRAGEEAKALVRIEADGPNDLLLPTPGEPGQWELRLVLCQEGAGPVDEGGEASPALSVSLVNVDVAA